MTDDPVEDARRALEMSCIECDGEDKHSRAIETFESAVMAREHGRIEALIEEASVEVREALSPARRSAWLDFRERLRALLRPPQQQEPEEHQG